MGNCLQSTNFSCNQRPTKRRFFPTREIRQGNPPLPFLFIIMADVLCWLMTKGVGRYGIEGDILLAEIITILTRFKGSIIN